MPDGSTLPEILLDSVRQRVRAQDGASTLELAVGAAVQPMRKQRAWALVGLAGRLREGDNATLAWLAIDGAVALDADPDATRAAYTVAVALHADGGDLRTALAVGERLLADGHDEYLLKAMARVYWELWQETEEQVWRDRLRRIDALLNSTPASHL